MTLAFSGAAADGDCTNFSTQSHPITGGRDSSDPTRAVIYWTVNSANPNAILDQGEHAVIAIAFDAENSERPAALDKLRAEVLVPTGAPLTVERSVPNITNLVVDMG